MEDKLKIRLRAFFFLLSFVFLLFGGRLWQLQIIHGDHYEALSMGNRTQVLPISAPRGRIMASDGTILVSNRFAFSVSIIPGKLTSDQLEEVAGFLTDLLKVDEEEIIRRVKNAGRSENPVRIKRNISREEMVIIEENSRLLPGVIIEKVPLRDYVYDNYASHLLGYLGEVSTSDLNHLFSKGYRAGGIIGREGLERSYEDYLKGEDGKRQIEIDSLGREMRTLGVKNPREGNDLLLYLDHNLQREAERILAEHLEYLTIEAEEDDEILGPPTGGAVIILNPHQGEVYAMASNPSYNPNSFAAGISAQEWQELAGDPHHPLVNRALSKTPPPGSVFKVITASAALEELGIDSETEYHDPGFFQLGNARWYNWMDYGQGDINFIDAMAYSNNTYFYSLGYDLHRQGNDRLQWYGHQYGLGYLSGIDLPGEKAGIVPNNEYKWRTEQEGWYPGDTINISIGQGSLQTTPLQLVNVIAAVANGGSIYQPRVVDRILSPEGEVLMENKPQLLNTLPLNSNNLELLTEGLEAVTSYGTAASVFKDFPLQVAGKTGTAETSENRPNHGLFIGYAPADDPEIAFVVFIEHGTSSSRTLPLAHDLLVSYFQLEDEYQGLEDKHLELEEGDGFERTN